MIIIKQQYLKIFYKGLHAKKLFLKIFLKSIKNENLMEEEFTNQYITCFRSSFADLKEILISSSILLLKAIKRLFK